MKKSSFQILLQFIPLLVFYIAIILIFSTDGLVADEGRHMVHAKNLIQGYYADAENPEIGNGPGYPLVIVPFVLGDAPNMALKLMNAVFLLIAVMYFFKTLSIYLTSRQAVALSYLLGLYPAILKWMIFMHSEALALLLACGFLYHFKRLFEEVPKRWPHIVFSAFYLGFLTLTKVLFGYVIIFSILVYLIVFIFQKSKKAKYTLMVLAGAFMMCTPYLYYTYSITGKAFYWGTQGGEILYWRSSPYADEFGDWISNDVVLGSDNHDYYDTSEIYKNHRPFVESLKPYSYVERDERFKEKGVENMKNYPLKYIQNTGASALRLFFNYPYSYTPQKASTYFYIIPNTLLLVFLVISVLLAIRFLKAIPFTIRFVVLVSSLFIGGLILLDGRVRHLIPILPFLLFFIIFVLKRLVSVKINTIMIKKEL